MKLHSNSPILYCGFNLSEKGKVKKTLYQVKCANNLQIAWPYWDKRLLEKGEVNRMLWRFVWFIHSFIDSVNQSWIWFFFFSTETIWLVRGVIWMLPYILNEMSEYDFCIPTSFTSLMIYDLPLKFLNPLRTKTTSYLFLRGNKSLLYHQIGNRNFLFSLQFIET